CCLLSYQQERLRLTLGKETSAGLIGQQFLSYNLIRAQKNFLESFFEVWAWPVTSRRSAYRRRDERAKNNARMNYFPISNVLGWKDNAAARPSQSFKHHGGNSHVEKQFRAVPICPDVRRRRRCGQLCSDESDLGRRRTRRGNRPEFGQPLGRFV